jgi:multiple sugar transport system ATP-binding protein
MASIEIRDVDKAYGATQVLHDVNLQVADGEFLVLVGPSGCGKSTLLRLIAGLEEVSAGDIVIGGRVVNDLPPKDRDIAMVFQNYALYPHMTVAENMAFSLRMRKQAKAEAARKVTAAAETLDLAAFLDRFPRQLSGGQRQRVAMGRAIVRDPQVFLFDEPLSNLDAKLRVQMRVEIKSLHQRIHATSIYVTHDQIEAMTMADRIVVLQEGRVEQIGTPLELYDHPANLFVAGFIGSPAMNFIRGRLRRRDASAHIEADDGTRLPNGSDRGGDDGQEVVYSFRPEHLTLGATGHGIAATILVVEPTGAGTHLYCGAGGAQVCAVFGERLAFKPGETIWLQPKAELVHVFDAATGKVLQ